MKQPVPEAEVHVETSWLAGDWWVENLLRPVLIAAMLVCLAAPPVEILEWLMPGWDGSYFLVFAFLAGLEGILSERALRKRRITGWSYLASRASEALILLILLKLVNYIPLGLDQLWADALIWSSEPALFFSLVDLLTGMLFLCLWAGALSVSRRASEMDRDPGKAAPPPDKTSTEYYLWLTQPSPVRDRQEALESLGDLFVWGGLTILIASALVHLLVPSVGAPALPTVLYFALGVALLSQARFSVARAGWQVQGIPIQRDIARRWLLWAVIFLVGVALLALLLPTGYAMGPVQALYSLIGILIRVLVVIIALITYLLVLLLSLFLPSMPPPERPTLALQPIPAAPPPTAASSTPWLEVLLSALFWSLILGIVGYALVRFLRERLGPSVQGEEAEMTWWGRLWAWLGALWRWWRSWGRGVQDRLARRRAGRRAEPAVRTALSRFLSLRRLPPRELVRYFYLSTTRRAAHVGQPRGPGQTPYEYQEALEGRFPELEPDLAGLTDAFIQARYSQRPVEEEDAEAVKPLWQRIKAALQRRRAKPGD